MILAHQGHSRPTSAFLMVILLVWATVTIGGLSPAVQSVSMVTVPIRLTVAYSGPSTSVTVSGCSANPHFLTANGVTHVIHATPRCTLTLSLPVAGHSRYVSPIGTSHISVRTCASGTCSGFASKLFRQFSKAFSYSISGGGAPAAPVLHFYSHGSLTSTALSKTAKTLWVDAYRYSSTNPLGGSSATERWYSSAPSGTIAGAGSVVITYYNQAYVNISAAGPGTTSPTSGWFRIGSAVSIGATPRGGDNFHKWTSTSLIRVLSPGSFTTTAEINGTGVVTGYFNPINTTTSLGGEAALVDQTPYSGINVTIYNAPYPDGTRVTVTSADLSAQPAGTGPTNLNGTKFFDVRVSGILNGTALVCVVAPPLNSLSVMKYWSGASWVLASGFANPSTGVICGEIPVADLHGTPIVVGTS